MQTTKTTKTAKTLPPMSGAQERIPPKSFFLEVLAVFVVRFWG
jgi:hypothetical protein